MHFDDQTANEHFYHSHPNQTICHGREVLPDTWSWTRKDKSWSPMNVDVDSCRPWSGAPKVDVPLDLRTCALRVTVRWMRLSPYGFVSHSVPTLAEVRGQMLEVSGKTSEVKSQDSKHDGDDASHSHHTQQNC